jgi:hypothetical protein
MSPSFSVLLAWEIPDLITLIPSSDMDGTTPDETVVDTSTEISDTINIDDDAWSTTYSADDAETNETSYLHGLSFLDETDESGINVGNFSIL